MAQSSQDATIADADVHKVVLVNEHIRVWEARAAAGWGSPMHTHLPMHIVGIGSARQKVRAPDGQTQIVDLRVEVKAAQTAKGKSD